MLGPKSANASGIDQPTKPVPHLTGAQFTQLTHKLLPVPTVGYAKRST